MEDNFDYINYLKNNPLLKESYVDKAGNLIDKADFVILEGGMRGGIFKDVDKINTSNYINFTTKLTSFRKKDVVNKIYKQIIDVYNGSALKKYNEKIGFTPSLDYSVGGGFDASGYDIKISEGIIIDGLVEPSHYYPETGFDEFIKGMRGTLGIDQSKEDKEAEKIKNVSKDSERMNVNAEDIHDKVMNVSVVCIPKYNWGGQTLKELEMKLDTGNHNFDDKHNLYSKSDLLKDLNEIGLELISHDNTKDETINLKETKFSLYVVKSKIKYTKEFKSHYYDKDWNEKTDPEDEKIIKVDPEFKDKEEIQEKTFTFLWESGKNREEVIKYLKDKVYGYDPYYLSDKIRTSNGILSWKPKEVKHQVKSLEKFEPIEIKVQEFKNKELSKGQFKKLKAGEIIKK